MFFCATVFICSESATLFVVIIDSRAKGKSPGSLDLLPTIVYYQTKDKSAIRALL